MRSLLLVVAMAVSVSAAEAQTYTVNDSLVWSAPANAMDVADAQQAVYRLYVDGQPREDIAGHICTAPEPGDTVATCAAKLTEAQFPLVNKRKVTIALTVRDPEPGAPEIGPGPALVLARPFVLALAPRVTPEEP